MKNISCGNNIDEKVVQKEQQLKVEKEFRMLSFCRCSSNFGTSLCPIHRSGE